MTITNSSNTIFSYSVGIWGTLLWGSMEPLASTTQSVSQTLSRLELDLKPGLIFHGHSMVTPGQIRFLGSYDLGLHPKAVSKPTCREGWMDKYNLSRILTLTHFITQK